MTDPIKDLIENLKKKGVNVDENNIRASLTNQKSASEFYKQNESELRVDKDYFMSFVNTPTRFEVEHENANRQLRNTERDYQRLQNKLRDDAEKGVQSADQLFSDVEVLEKRRNDLQQTVSKLNEKARTKSRFDLEQEFEPSEFESAIVSSKLDKDVIKSNKSTKAFITEESDKLVPFLSDQEKEVYAPIKQIQLEEDSNTSLKQMVDNLSSKKRTHAEEMQFVAAKNALDNSNKKIDELKGFYQRKKTEIESSATDFIKQKKAEKTAIINTLLPEGIKDEDLVQKMIADDPELDKKIRQIDKDIDYANTKIGGFLTQPKAVLSDKEDLLNRIDYLLPGISVDPLTKVKAYAVAKNRILQDLKNTLAHPKGDESAKEIYSIPEKMIAIEEELAELAPIALLNRSNSADVQKYSDSIYKNISVALKNSGIAIVSKFLGFDAKYDSPKIQAEIIEKSLNIIGEKQNVRPDIYDQTFGNPEEASALFDENQKLLDDRVFKETEIGKIEYWKSNKSREKYYSNLKEIESKRGELNQSNGFYSGLEMAGLSFKIGVDLFLSSVLVETGIGVGIGTAKALTTVKNIDKIRRIINENKVVKATFEGLRGIKDTGNYTRGQIIAATGLKDAVTWGVASTVIGGKAWEDTGGSEGFLGGVASAALEQVVPKPIIGLLSGPGKSKLRDFALKFAGQLPVEYVQENAEQFATTVKKSTGSSNFLTGAAKVIANGLQGGEKWESIKEDFSKTMGWEAQKEMAYSTAFLSTMFATGSGMGEVFKNMYLDNGGDAKMLEDMSFYLNGVKKIVYDRNTYHYTGERWVDKNKKEVAPEIAAKLNEASPNTKLGDVKELESVASFVKGEWVSENGTKLEGDSLDKIIHGFRGLEEQESVVSDYKTKDVKIAEIEKDEKLTDEEKSQNIQAIPEDNFIQSDEDVIEAKQGQVLYTKNNSVFYTTKQEGSKAVSLSSDSKLVKFEDGKYYIEQKSPIEGSYEVTSGSEFRLAQAIKAANTRQGRALRTVRAFIPITKAIKKSVNGKLQGLKIVLHDGESYSKLDKGSRGHYDKASHTVHLNLSSSLGVTANHEILHPFFNAIFDATPNAKDLFYSQVSQEYKDRYQDVDEAIVEYASDRIVYAATPKLDTDPNFFARIFNNARDIVSRFAGRDAMPLDTDLNSLIGAMAQVGTQRGNNPIIKYLEGLSNKEVDTGSQKTWTERAMSILGIPNATVNGIPYSNEDISRQLEEGLDKTISKIKDTFKKIEGFDYEASELASEHISDSAKEWVDYLENSNAPIEFRALLAAELFEYKYDGTYKERNGGIFDEFNEKHIKEVLQEGKKEGLLKQLYDKKQAAIQQQKIEDENTISEQLRKEQEQERERSGGKDTVEEYTDQLSKIKNYAAEVISNRAEIQRLSKEDERGRIEGGIRNVEATILLAASGRESGQIKGREEQQRAIEDYAKAEGIWYDNIDANPDIGTIQNGLGKYKDSGMENQVYIPIDNPNIVRKTMKTTDPTNKDNDNEVLYHLDTRISAHNAGIGSTAPYTVIGFGRLSNGDFVVISEQPHIQDARMATREEISDEMQKMGYDLDGKDSFSDQDHFITDINPKNVLVSKEGTFHFIDTIYDIFNVNDEDSNRLSGIIQQQKIEDEKPRVIAGDQSTRDRTRWDPSRGNQTLEGAPIIEGATGADPEITSIAEEYAINNGIPFKRQEKYVDVDIDRATRIADEYENMAHDPENPEVSEAYNELVSQVIDQYKALEQAGYKFYFFDEENDPYDSNPYNAMRDLRQNKTMGVFATEAGYGEGQNNIVSDNNPMLKDTGIEWTYGPDGEKKRVLVNDLFRAIHDVFGHGLEGSGFRAKGEENAFQSHVRLFYGKAVGALATETRGQNSWVNFGKHGEHNRKASANDTIFAEQKIGLMPEWTWTEGVDDFKVDPSTVQQQKIEDKSPLADIVNGFYSNTENALLQVPQEKMSGSKWKSQLLSRGANSDEMKWTTLLNYLEDNKDKSVSKNDIRQYLKDNRIQVVEVVKDGGISEEEIDTLLNDEVGQDMTRDEARAFLENDERQDDTKFSQYQLEGEKGNYKEVLVTMPSKDTNYQIEFDNYISELAKKYGVSESSVGSLILTETEQEKFNTIKNGLIKQRKGKSIFKSSHFEDPNILVHLRMNTRTDADGNKVLFLEEIQSDWGQIGKKEGFGSNEKNDYNKLASELQGEYEVDGQDIFSDVINVKQGTPIQKLNAMDRLTKYFGKERALKIVENQGQSKIPSAPFVTDTNAWTKLALKVALKESIKQSEQMQRTAFEKLVDEKMDWVEARMKKLGKLEVKCP